MCQKIILCKRNLRTAYKHRTPQRKMAAADEKINFTGQGQETKCVPPPPHHRGLNGGVNRMMEEKRNLTKVFQYPVN